MKLESSYIAPVANRFKQAMLSVDIDALDCDAYNKSYIRRYLEKLDYNIYLAVHLYEKSSQSHSEVTVVDLGGGCGFNSAFYAFLLSTEKLVYLDIDPESKRAAVALHEALGISKIEYRVGGLEAIEDLLHQETVLLSRDVIEHVYDLEAFFTLSSKAGSNVHNTAAMKPSLFRSSEFKAIHHRAEKKGNDSKLSKQRDQTRPYLELRKELISEMGLHLVPSEIERLAKATRGLNVSDIQRFVKHGLSPRHHLACLYTNTCDPLTGNWAERCITKSDYQKFAGPTGLRFSYPKWNSFALTGAKKWAMQTLNIFALSRMHRIQPSLTIAY